MSQINELGSLRLQAVTRSLFDALSEFVTKGSLRPRFARWQQCLSLWAMEKLPDVYTLRFPVPAIAHDEVKAVLRCRVDFNPLGIDGVAVDRLNCVMKPALKT